MRQLETSRHEILAAIASLTLEHGYSPTIREIGAKVGIKSPSTMQIRLQALAEAGLVTYQPHLARTLAITDAGRAEL